jgi:transcriptional regulator with XRE-family HTH domain
VTRTNAAEVHRTDIGTANGAPDTAAPVGDYGKRLGARLRAIRQQQRLSLSAVQELSGGRWKAVVVGSYERGDRALTVARLAELAAFYNVPIAEIVPPASVSPPDSRAAAAASTVMLDLQALRALPVQTAGPLTRFANAIQDQRQDYSYSVLSLRREDLRALAIIYDRDLDELLAQLDSWGVLLN